MEGIGLSVGTFDLDGALLIRGSDLDASQDFRNNTRDRRVSRTATLDGGVSIYDTGYSASDRTITVRVPKATSEIVAFFNYLVETYSLINIMTAEAAFDGTPMRCFNDEAGGATLVIGIKSKIS